MKQIKQQQRLHEALDRRKNQWYKIFEKAIMQAFPSEKAANLLPYDYYPE